ncbi:unnamed protein product [Peniophora sp. CBMAI 1063]|nr:unnamed protein product [Peniophora sp. CBMAI 1063]
MPPKASSSKIQQKVSKTSEAQDTKKAALDALGYGYENVAHNEEIKTFITRSVKERVETFHSMSPVLRGLPFKSAALKLPDALDFTVLAYPSDKDVTRQGWSALQTAATTVANWERRVFVQGKGQKHNKHRKAFVRKLHLVSGDQAKYPPLALADVARHFLQIHNDSLANWISSWCLFVAFDLVASHTAPSRTMELVITEDMVPYQRVSLEPDVVARYENLMGNYQANIRAWIESACEAERRHREQEQLLADASRESKQAAENPSLKVMEVPTASPRSGGVYDMVSEGAKQEIEAIVQCNVGMTALALQQMLQEQPGDHELVLEVMQSRLRDLVQKGTLKLPETWFTKKHKEETSATDSVIAFLCAAMISPLALLSNVPLYGGRAGMAVQDAIMCWQQLAPLVLPQWIKDLGRDVIGVAVEIAFSKGDVDGRKLLWAVAKKWKDIPLPACDVDFFHGRLISTVDLEKENRFQRIDAEAGTPGPSEHGDRQTPSTSATGSQTPVDTVSGENDITKQQADNNLSASSSKEAPESHLPDSDEDAAEVQKALDCSMELSAPASTGPSASDDSLDALKQCGTDGDVGQEEGVHRQHSADELEHVTGVQFPQLTLNPSPAPAASSRARSSSLHSSSRTPVPRSMPASSQQHTPTTASPRVPSSQSPPPLPLQRGTSPEPRDSLSPTPPTQASSQHALGRPSTTPIPSGAVKTVYSSKAKGTESPWFPPLAESNTPVDGSSVLNDLEPSSDKLLISPLQPASTITPYPTPSDLASQPDTDDEAEKDVDRPANAGEKPMDVDAPEYEDQETHEDRGTTGSERVRNAGDGEEGSENDEPARNGAGVERHDHEDKVALDHSARTPIAEKDKDEDEEDEDEEDEDTEDEVGKMEERSGDARNGASAEGKDADEDEEEALLARNAQAPAAGTGEMDDEEDEEDAQNRAGDEGGADKDQAALAESVGDTHELDEDQVMQDSLQMPADDHPEADDPMGEVQPPPGDQRKRKRDADDEEEMDEDDEADALAQAEGDSPRRSKWIRLEEEQKAEEEKQRKEKEKADKEKQRQDEEKEKEKAKAKAKANAKAKAKEKEKEKANANANAKGKGKGAQEKEKEKEGGKGKGKEKEKEKEKKGNGNGKGKGKEKQKEKEKKHSVDNAHALRRTPILSTPLKQEDVEGDDKAALELVKKRWHKQWPTYIVISSDEEEPVVKDKPHTKPVLEPLRSFNAQAFGRSTGLGKSVSSKSAGKPQVRADDLGSGGASGSSRAGPSQPRQEGSDMDAEGSTDEGEVVSRPPPPAGEKKNKNKKKKKGGAKKQKRGRSEDTPPPDAESDTWWGNSSDETASELSDSLNINKPIRLAEKQYSDFEEECMPLWDVNFTIPKSIRNYGRAVGKEIQSQMDQRIRDKDWPTNFIKFYSMDEWMSESLEDIEAMMGEGFCFHIRDTGLDRGWDWNVKSAERLKSGASFVDAQEFVNPHHNGGVQHYWLPVGDMINPMRRDYTKVVNCLNLPLNGTVVPIPRQHELDIGSLAYQARKEAVKARQENPSRPLGVFELGLDASVITGLNWSIISQAHSWTDGHVDTAGVFTAIVVLTGVKYWAIRKTLLTGDKDDDIDVFDCSYFEELNDRDLDSLPGGSAAWVAVLLFPGDILIMHPNARHLVYTIKDSMMTGIHLYHHRQLLRSVCGWTIARFSHTTISNAEHHCFLSILQSFSTFWWPGYKSHVRETLSEDHPILRTLPDPKEREGLDSIVALALVTVFNNTLSGVAKPYRGAYYTSDRRSFKSIWLRLTETGFMSVTCDNLPSEFSVLMKKALGLGDPSIKLDNRWTCAGLTQLLVHFARALIQLSCRWAAYQAPVEWVAHWPEDPEDQEDYAFDSEGEDAGINEDDKDDYWLSPAKVRSRALIDLGNAVGLPYSIASQLVGTVHSCWVCCKPAMVPLCNWVDVEDGTITRRPSLWDALDAQSFTEDDLPDDDMDE